ERCGRSGVAEGPAPSEHSLLTPGLLSPPARAQGPVPEGFAVSLSISVPSPRQTCSHRDVVKRPRTLLTLWFCLDVPPPAPSGPPVDQWEGRTRMLGPPPLRGACRAAAAVALVLLGVPGSRADDWPQWLGPRGDSVWRETGILEKFPKGGPEVRWRV